jgi:predicted aldo/keto reductase-like oxidoreductase
LEVAKMSKKNQKTDINRRGFLKTIGAAGIGSALLTTRLFAESKDANKPNPNIKDPNSAKERMPEIPTRDFGNKGFKVPCFALGAMFDTVANIAVLRKALQLGVTFWDCAYGYANGNAELGIGKIFEEQPALRKKMVVTSKSRGSPETIENHLQESLKRMKTDYIDIYYIHGLDNPEGLTEDIKKWVEGAKKRKLIRFFGFSTHSNMTGCLSFAAKAGWIDAAIMTYNFRVMQDAEMNDAVEACNKAGVALIAMKTQGRMQQAEQENEKAKEAVEYFTKKGFTDGQAKIKAVLQDKRICSACVGVGRGNIEHLISDVDAVLDKRQLDNKDVAFLADYAQKTCDGYCAGCSKICTQASPDMPYIADVMRYLMYYNSYGDREMARQLYAELPADVRVKMTSVDYSLAESRCPNRMPVARLMSEAAGKLT